MAKIRDPARDEAKKIYLENKGITNREIANRLNVDEKKIATWKYRDNWDSTSKKKNVVQQNKDCSTTNKKKLIQKAKAMVISGSTLEEASDKTGLKESTLRNYSAKENWIDKQEKYMQKVYEELQKELGEIHIYDRKLATKFIHNSLNEVIKKDYEKSINIKEIALKTEIMNFVIKSIKGQSELIGITDIKSLVDINLSEQDLEIKKQKYKDPKGKDKTGTFLDKLEEFL